MAQYLKAEVQERVARAAREVFAESGFPKATMAQIARAAGVSTGNLYRYYESKEVLFEAVVPPSVARDWLDLTRRRMGALRSGDVEERAAAHRMLSEQQLAFCIAHRLELVVVLGRAEGTRYEGFADRLVGTMTEMALEHFRARRPGLSPAASERFALELVYRNLLSATVRVLSRFDREDAIREAVEAYSRYHFVGLGSLFS